MSSACASFRFSEIESTIGQKLMSNKKLALCHSGYGRPDSRDGLRRLRVNSLPTSQNEYKIDSSPVTSPAARFGLSVNGSGLVAKVSAFSPLHTFTPLCSQ